MSEVSQTNAVPAAGRAAGDRATAARAAVRAPVWIRPERVKELSLVGVILLMLLVFSFLVDDYWVGGSSTG